MKLKDFELIAGAIHRSGMMKDNNKIRQKAAEDMRRLIACDFIGSLKEYSDFNEKKFLVACGF